MAQQAQSEFQTVRIPLVGVFNTREFDSSGTQITGPSSGTVGIGVVGDMIVGNQIFLNKDQRFVNCIPTALMNELTENKTYYLVKRPGWEQEENVDLGEPGKYLLYWGIKNAGAQIVTAWRDTNSRIFEGTNSLGDITGECVFMLEFTLGTKAAFAIQSDDNTLWYHVEGMTTSMSGNTNTNTTISGLASTSNLYVGQLVTGTDIPADTRIATIASSTSITITNAATGSTGGVTFTFSELAKVLDTDYPGNMTPAKTIMPGMVFLDGYLFVMDSDGVIYNSDLNSVTSWAADGFISSNSYPDKGITITRYRNLIASFSTTSLEFFADAGNPSGSPLINNTQATVKIGAANPYGVAAVEDSLVWVSSTDKGGSSVYILEDYSPKKISTPIIDQAIALAGADTAKINIAKFFGRTFIFVITTNNTFVFCVEDKMWHEWSSDGNYWDVMAVASIGTNHVYGISHSSSSSFAGILWKINVENVVYTDNGTQYTMLVQTSKLDNDNIFRKRISRLKVVGDRPEISSPLEISWSDDDYKTWSPARTVDLMDNYPYTNNLGMYRRRAFRLSNLSDTSVRLEAIELDIIQGTS